MITFVCTVPECIAPSDLRGIISLHESEIDFINLDLPEPLNAVWRLRMVSFGREGGTRQPRPFTERQSEGEYAVPRGAKIQAGTNEYRIATVSSRLITDGINAAASAPKLPAA